MACAKGLPRVRAADPEALASTYEWSELPLVRIIVTIGPKQGATISIWKRVWGETVQRHLIAAPTFSGPAAAAIESCSVVWKRFFRALTPVSARAFTPSPIPEVSAAFLVTAPAKLARA